MMGNTYLFNEVLFKQFICFIKDDCLQAKIWIFESHRLYFDKSKLWFSIASIKRMGVEMRISVCV